jgi:hypothetical protein
MKRSNLWEMTAKVFHQNDDYDAARTLEEWYQGQRDDGIMKKYYELALENAARTEWYQGQRDDGIMKKDHELALENAARTEWYQDQQGNGTMKKYYELALDKSTSQEQV